MKKTLDELLKAHRAELQSPQKKSRKLVELENLLRDHAPEKRPPKLLRWLSTVTGQSQHVIRARRELWVCGDAADPLWVRLDAGMSVTQVSQILYAARKEAPRRRPDAFRAAIEKVLRKHDHLPEDGTPAQPAPESFPQPTLSPRDFWRGMRQALMAHFIERVGEVIPEYERELLLDDLESDLRVLFTGHNQKWQKLSNRIDEMKKVSRGSFLRALRTLNVDPPRRGEPLNPLLGRAKKQQRALARLYHPDTNGGSEQTREHYQEVIEAFLTVEKYVEEHAAQAATPPNLRVIKGSKK